MVNHDAPAPLATDATTYSKPARIFHWVTAAVVFVMVPVGLWMSYRGNTLDIWDGLTNGLYSGHKLTGFLLLWLIVARLVYRLMRGAPRDEPTLLWWHKAASHTTHWLLYGLLLIVPMLGWIGVSLYPALDIFGLFNLPALATPNEQAAAKGAVSARHAGAAAGGGRMRPYRRGDLSSCHPQGRRAAAHAAAVALVRGTGPPQC